MATPTDNLRKDQAWFFYSRPKMLSLSRTAKAIADFLWRETNFFRLHVAAFVLVPLIISGIFYASNGQYHIRYIDSLFLCYTAMTDTGLTTVNLSTLTAWQQAVLYLLVMLGDTTFVSWLMVMTRKHYFRTKCRYVASRQPLPRPRRSRGSLLGSISAPVNTFLNRQVVPLRKSSPFADPETAEETMADGIPIEDTSNPRQGQSHGDRSKLQEGKTGDTSTSSPSPKPMHDPVSSDDQHTQSGRERSIPPARHRRVLTFQDEPYLLQRSQSLVPNSLRTAPGVYPPSAHDMKYKGFGGFPGPVDILDKALKRAAPSAYRRLERSMTVPHTETLEGRDEPWLNFDGLVVGRNSDFRTETLTSEQIKEIGGTEYRALRLLSLLVPAYALGIQMIGFLIYGPWLQTTNKYDAAFQAQPRLVPKAWFSVFQVASAYTGTGLSLMDLSMIPFQQAYLMIFGILFVQLAGNPAQPILLRFIIWLGYKSSHVTSETRQTLSFLLHHPRRCFLYLFPSHQTYFLCIVLVLLSALEWIAFGILNIGLPAFQALPVGTRIVTGLFQGVAARASGFQIVSIAALAPALQFLYVVMMYIAIYPIALCIRATNVYEERSLGIFEAPLGEIKEDLAKLPSRERVGRYVSWHLRRQLSIDIWWLVWGIFIVAIVERENLMDENKRWFNMFSLIFELVSAFAGIGLSLGFPGDNFSLVGTMKPLSKIVIIVIMIRGRHRGLPVAIDRAVLLPTEFVVNPATSPEGRSPGPGNSGAQTPADSIPHDHPANV